MAALEEAGTSLQSIKELLRDVELQVAFLPLGPAVLTCMHGPCCRDLLLLAAFGQFMLLEASFCCTRWPAASRPMAARVLGIQTQSRVPPALCRPWTPMTRLVMQIASYAAEMAASLNELADVEARLAEVRSLLQQHGCSSADQLLASAAEAERSLDDWFRTEGELADGLRR